jgi:hypothetical protein
MGKDWQRMSEMLHQHLRLGSVVVALVIAAWFLIRWLQRKVPEKSANK